MQDQLATRQINNVGSNVSDLAHKQVQHFLYVKEKSTERRDIVLANFLILESPRGFGIGV